MVNEYDPFGSWNPMPFGAVVELLAPARITVQEVPLGSPLSVNVTGYWGGDAGAAPGVSTRLFAIHWE